VYDRLNVDECPLPDSEANVRYMMSQFAFVNAAHSIYNMNDLFGRTVVNSQIALDRLILWMWCTCTMTTVSDCVHVTSGKAVYPKLFNSTNTIHYKTITTGFLNYKDIMVSI
jgi:hypothetical protein